MDILETLNGILSLHPRRTVLCDFKTTCPSDTITIAGIILPILSGSITPSAPVIQPRTPQDTVFSSLITKDARAVYILSLVLDAEQMGTDFVQFLSNLVKVFPSLSARPLVIAGESYAGTWIVSFVCKLQANCLIDDSSW